VKAAVPLADMMLAVNDWTDVVKMVEKMEGRMGAGRPSATGVGPSSFKSLERFYVPGRVSCDTDGVPDGGRTCG
jgi:hypothetical protein